MEQFAGNAVKGFFDKMCEELKSFRLLVWAKYLSMLCGLLVLFSALNFSGGFWLSILALVFGAVMLFLDFADCFVKCFKDIKKLNEMVTPLREPTYKGILYIVIGAILFKKTILASILTIICGVFYVGGVFFDKKKDGMKAPMV